MPIDKESWNSSSRKIMLKGHCLYQAKAEDLDLKLTLFISFLITVLIILVLE